MKNLNVLFATMLGVFAVLSSCNKKDDSPTYYMNMTIDGIPYSASDVSYSKNVTATDNYTIINGSSGGNNILEITLTGYNNTTGSMPFDVVTASARLNLDHNSFAKKGIIRITSVSPILSGTFSFVCYDSTEVTEGSFSCLAQ